MIRFFVSANYLVKARPKYLRRVSLRGISCLIFPHHTDGGFFVSIPSVTGDCAIQGTPGGAAGRPGSIYTDRGDVENSA